MGVLCLFALPPLLLRLSERVDNRNWLVSWSAATLVLILGFQGWGFFLGLTAVILYLETGRETAYRTKIAWVIFTVWSGLILSSSLLGKIFQSLTLGPSLRSILAPGVLIDPIYFALALLSAGIISRWVSRQTLEKKTITDPRAIWALCVLLALVAFQISFKTGETTRTPMARAVYDAQMWAHRNTPEFAFFVVTPDDMSWRVLSLRRAVNSDIGPGIAYSGTRKLMEYGNRQREFFAKHGVNSLADLSDQASIIEFAKEFGGDYVVTTKQNRWKLKKLYENDLLVVYRLPPSDSSGQPFAF